MGIGPFSHESLSMVYGSARAEEAAELPAPARVDVRDAFIPVSPNPNPERFTVDRVMAVGSFVVCLVNYVDATNFEGNKIMLIKNMTAEEAMMLRVLDPHFSEDSNIVARFRPDEAGWDTAVLLADTLTNNTAI